MGKKTETWRRIFVFMLALSVLIQNLSMTGIKTVKAEETGSKISISAEQITAKAANSHGAELAVDGDTDTYWQSIPSNGEGDNLKRMYDHNHYIDITLDGTYNLSQVKIFNLVNGSYNNYYVYASVDGENYDKIISKTSNDPATAEGDSYTLGNVSASYLRLNMAYNSDAFATNLSEIEVYGTKINDTVEEPKEIRVEDWEGSKWQVEWDKFESNQAYANQKVLTEMSSLVGRVLGDSWKASFRFEFRSSLEEGKDIFEVKDGTGGTIVIRGNSGLAMASGFNYYLKNYVNIDYNPLYASNTELKELVPVGGRIVKEAQFDVRYALNFCTYSYTMAFWNWDEYEEFLDWCAMNGINLVLDIVGQEEVLRQTLLEFNYTDEEIKDYICGPAYFAWFYMQNLYSVGGPLPNAWFEQRAELGRQIHDRMQTYGISPVIQGFAGQVPETFAEKNEGAVLIATGNWSGFTRPTMIRTYLTDAELASGKVNYFSEAAKVFYEKQQNVFGNVSHYYATDPFHEGGNTGGLDTATIFSEVQKEMLKSDADAIWVMQQWQGNLNSNNISKLDKSKTLPLILQADMKTYEKDDFEQWEMQWVYCMLHDFGGRMGLDGEVPVIAVDPIETFHNTDYMAGIGITAEALENSPVVYELMFDTNWSKDPIDYYAWLKKYSERRAGGESESLWKAWKILLNTAYADKGITYQGAAETVINARPADSFSAASTWGNSNILYDKAELDQALLLLAENYEAFSDSPAFKYDLADVAEQVLCNAAVEYHRLMVQAKNEGDLQKFEQLSTAFLNLIDLSDQILSTTDEFMLGTWIEASRKMITDADDWTKDLFEFNARSLVTTWAGERPCTSGLKDYSNRKWAGLTSSFYKERWAIWIRNRIADLKGEDRNVADAKAESNWFLWEYQWVNRKSDDNDGAYAYATEPSGADLAKLAKQAYDRFSYTNLEKNTGGTAQETLNIAKGKNAVTTSSTQSGTLQNITDGDTGTEWIAAGAGPHTVEIDLEAAYDLSRIVLSGPQRAGDIPYTWKVEYYNPNTAEWILLQENTGYGMSSNTEIEASANCTASKIRVTMSTSDAQTYPVEITEITVNVVEEENAFENLALGITADVDRETSTDNSALSYLTDGKTSTLWKTAGNTYPVNAEIDLPQAFYVDSVEVYFESEGRPFTFYVTVTDESGNEIEISPAECKNHTSTLKQGSYTMAVEKKISKVVVTLTGSTGQGSYWGSWPAIAEIMVMGLSGEVTIEMLQEKINSVRTLLGGLEYGVSKGQYKDSAKTAAESVLTEIWSEAQAAEAPDAKQIEEWIVRVNDALDVFYETGVVYLNRDVLLAAMADAVELMEKQMKYECLDGMADLQAAYNSARTAYETYEITQSAIDAAQSALDGVVQTVKAAVGSNIDVAEVSEAKNDLQQFVTDMEEKEENDYTVESWAEYEAALTAVNQILNGMGASQEEIAAAKFRLSLAMGQLTSAIKVKTITVSAEGGKTALKVNETVQLAASVLPENATDTSVEWSSGTPSLATVTDQGLVTAKADGMVTITATAKDKSGVTGKITLTITKNSTGDTTNPSEDNKNPSGDNKNPAGDMKEPGTSTETPGGSNTDTKKLPAAGTIYKTTALQYKITKSTESAKTVTVQKSVKKNPKKIVIPATVSIEGYSYQVTEIAAKAFRKNTKLTKVSIGANITKIGNQAFYGCKKLKTITVTAKGITGIGKKAFAGIHNKAKITVPKQKFKNYKTLFKKAKTAKTVTIKKK